MKGPQAVKLGSGLNSSFICIRTKGRYYSLHVETVEDRTCGNAAGLVTADLFKWRRGV